MAHPFQHHISTLDNIMLSLGCYAPTEFCKCLRSVQGHDIVKDTPVSLDIQAQKTTSRGIFLSRLLDGASEGVCIQFVGNRPSTFALGGDKI